MSAVATAGIPANARVTFLRELRSEWIKFFAVRSTPWILVVTLVVMVGFSAIQAAGLAWLASNPDQAGGVPADPAAGVTAVTFGYGVGQIVFIVLGAMRATGEYSTGQIRSTLAAVPTRLPVLVAKAVLVAVTSLVVGLVAVALSTGLVTLILEPHGMAPDLSDEASLRAILGVPLYLTAVALLSLGIGFMLRHTAGAIFAGVGLFVVLPILAIVPVDWVQGVLAYLPGAAGERLIQGDVPDAVLTPWQGYGVMLGWSALALLGGGVLLKRRDA